MWSEVFCEDMFSRFKREGVLNKHSGQDYRAKILQPGASKEGMKLLEDFLGRKPTEESFFASLGV
jgi:thimet oligopeptidase